MKRKLISILVCISILFVMMPGDAFADVYIPESERYITGVCGPDATYIFDSAYGELQINGSGAITVQPWRNDNNPNRIYSIVIGKNITNVSSACNLETLRRIEVEEGNPIFASQNGVLFNKEMTRLLQFPRNAETDGGNYRIPDTVTKLGAAGYENFGSFYGFAECKEINWLTIPASVQSIDMSFIDAPNMVAFDVDSQNPNYSSIDGILFNKAGTVIYCAPDCCYFENDEYVVPESVVDIAGGAFYGCQYLGSLTVGGNVNAIGNSAFDHCQSLTSVYIHDGVKRLGEWAFAECNNLQTVQLPNSIKEMGTGVFLSDEALTTVNIPTGISTLPGETFSGCRSLENITIPENITSIGYGSFSGCRSLQNIDIPSNVTSIEHNAFGGCSSLQGITIPETQTEIGYNMFAGCSSLQSISIPAGVTFIGDSAFSNCSGLQSINIPAGVTAINAAAFSGCSSLQSIDLPKGVTYIGESAFSKCYSLQSINLPAGVTSIGKRTFSYCGRLQTVNIPKSVTSIGRYAFFCCSSLQSIEIPAGITSISAWTFGACHSLQNINIPKSVTSIGKYAFYNCSSLKSIDLPAGVTSIDDGGFHGCSGLQSIDLPADVTYISEGIFKNCSGLKSVDLPASVTSIGRYAFFNCSNLQSIDLPAGVTSIDEGVFSGCSSLQSIHIPEGITSIGKRAFNNCVALESVTLPDSVKVIGGAAFSGAGLEQINMPKSLLDILPETFYGTKLTSVEIPGTVRSIGYSAFAGCENLSDLRFPSPLQNELQIGANAFDGCNALQSVTIPKLSGPYYEFGYIDYHAFNIPNLRVIFDGADSLPYMHAPFAGSAKLKIKCTAGKRIYDENGVGYDLFTTHNFQNGVCADCGIQEGVLEHYREMDDVVKYPIGNDQYLVFNTVTGFVTGLSWFDMPITEVNIPETIEGVAVIGIAEGAFMNETMLQTVTMGENIQTIGENAFTGSGIKNITIPDSVTQISGNAFENTELEAITLPISAEFTEGFKLPSLISFTFTKGNGEAIDYDSVTYKLTPWYINRKGDISITLKEGIEGIGDYTFAGQQISSYTLPASLHEIGDNAFYQNKKLTKVTMQEGVMKIGYEVFAECEMLESIILPKTLESMKYNSFAGDEKLVATVHANSYAKTAAAKYGIAYRLNTGGSVIEPEEKPDVTGQGEIELKGAFAKTGKTIEVPVVVTVNPGVASLKLDLEYDKTVLQLVNTVDGDDFDPAKFVRISQDTSDKLVWKTENMASDVTSTGTLVILEFKVNDAAANGFYTIKMTCDEANTLLSTGQERIFNCTDAVISVVDFIYGDVNDSADVNINDADYLAKYIAGWEAYQKINQDAADVDLNKKVTLRDAAIISRYVAGWVGYENMPNLADPLPMPSK